ncbi:Uncharacterised protein [Achromobacter ruhlandii]|nr:Uncharacterised protein [Achromobacter ruhlandii]
MRSAISLVCKIKNSPWRIRKTEKCSGSALISASGAGHFLPWVGFEKLGQRHFSPGWIKLDAPVSIQLKFRNAVFIEYGLVVGIVLSLALLICRSAQNIQHHPRPRRLKPIAPNTRAFPALVIQRRLAIGYSRELLRVRDRVPPHAVGRLRQTRLQRRHAARAAQRATATFSSRSCVLISLICACSALIFSGSSVALICWRSSARFCSAWRSMAAPACWPNAATISASACTCRRSLSASHFFVTPLLAALLRTFRSSITSTQCAVCRRTMIQRILRHSDSSGHDCRNSHAGHDSPFGAGGGGPQLSIEWHIGKYW